LSSSSGHGVLSLPGLVLVRPHGGTRIRDYAVNLATALRTLINDAAALYDAIKAYLDLVPAPAVKVQSSATVSGGYAEDATAVIDYERETHHHSDERGDAFIGWSAPPRLKITSTQLQGANIVMHYE